MARNVKQTLKIEDIKNQTIFFLIKQYPPHNDGNETILGPYLNKPKISKYWTKYNIKHEILEFKLIKK